MSAEPWQLAAVGYSYQLVPIPIARVEGLYCSRDDELFARMARPASGYAGSLMQIGEERGEQRMRAALRYVLVGGGKLRDYFEDCEPHEIGYAVEACCFEVANRSESSIRATSSAWGTCVLADARV